MTVASIKRWEKTLVKTKEFIVVWRFGRENHKSSDLLTSLKFRTNPLGFMEQTA